LVAFVSVDPALREAAVKFYEHVHDHDTANAPLEKEKLGIDPFSSL
jgi:hypothetical protein